jgi:hypothetical protein
MGMKMSFTKKPMNPSTANPSAVRSEILVNSARGHRHTRSGHRTRGTGSDLWMNSRLEAEGANSVLCPRLVVSLEPDAWYRAHCDPRGQNGPRARCSQARMDLTEPRRGRSEAPRHPTTARLPPRLAISAMRW